MKESLEIIHDARTCFHCGVKTKHAIVFESLDFCCNGCLSVYQILEKNNLCQYYNFNESPGQTIEILDNVDSKFAYLDDQTVLQKIYTFKQGTEAHITYYLPQVHCSSCLYLLENLYKIHAGVNSAKLNFSKKELIVVFDAEITSARIIANVLTKLGYEPYFSLNDIGGKSIKPKLSKTRLLRLGVAGFCFGNIMLLSFPEYFSWGLEDIDGLKPFFQMVILVLIVPVMTYSAAEFYKLAWGGLKEKYLNIDLPIVMAMFIAFGRSLYEVFTHTGPGYFDSLSGIVFFMLLGRLLQDKTYQKITFDRDYTSYFPISATVFRQGKEISKQLPDIEVNDELIIHDQEIIPVDGLLAAGEACIDYSFVTGESVPVTLNAGSWVYAGGRQLGSSVRVLAQKTVSQSYLVSLWNQQQKDGGESTQLESNYIQKASQYFSLGLFSLATLAAIYWGYTDSSKIWNAVTAVLLVACPCALLLSVTFTHGHFLSLLAKNGFYLKGPMSLDKMNSIKQIVFDKTGTLTQSKNPIIVYEGQKLNSNELDLVAAVANESIHPHARQISKYLDRAKLGVKEAMNFPGQGIKGIIGTHVVELGSKEFLQIENQLETIKKGSFIGIKIDGEFKGYFIIKSAFRPKLMPLVQELGSRFKLTVLSGDNDSEKHQLEGVFPSNTNMIFNQKPLDKRDFVAALESADCATMMVGDGLNDAGALMSSSFGLAITDDVSYFSPGSDAILLGDHLPQLGAFFKMAQKMRKIIWWSFAISIAYNVVGLFFAVRAELNPMIAAILMPASSISIVLFTWISSMISAKMLKLKI